MIKCLSDNGSGEADIVIPEGEVKTSSCILRLQLKSDYKVLISENVRQMVAQKVKGKLTCLKLDGCTKSYRHFLGINTQLRNS